MKKIGVSIPWDYLSGCIVTKEAELIKKTFNKAGNFLKFLQDLEVTHIELRHRKNDIIPVDMETVFLLLSDFKFKITIHGDDPLQENRWTVNKVFPWLDSYKKIFPYTDDYIMITLHPLTGPETESEYRVQTINYIKKLDDMILNDNLPIRLALENQRSKKIGDPGKSFIEIEGMWKEIDRSNVGICWDMGHCFANYLLDNTLYPIYPHFEFSAATTHTHIHDLGPDGRTHWIFKENRVPIASYIEQLKAAGYKGVYNLEVSFDRFAAEKNQRSLIKETIIKLREMI